MLFSSPIQCYFIRREKRFIMHAEYNGLPLIIHCPNTGSMHGLLQAGNSLIITKSDNPNRKLSYTAQLIHTNGMWVGINTHLPNALVEEALEHLFPSIQFYKKEVLYGEKSRIDFVVYTKNKKNEIEPVYVEVKNVHMMRTPHVAEFPDSVTTRGHKHLQELIRLTKQGVRCCILYVIQRSDAYFFKIAEDIDPLYAKLSQEAKNVGVEEQVCVCTITAHSIMISKKL